MMESTLATRVKRDAEGMTVEEARCLASTLLLGLPSFEVFDTRQLLAEHPEIARHEAAAVDLAFEEFSRRCHAGEQLDPETFSSRFSQIAAELREVIEISGYLDDHSSFFDGVDNVSWPELGQSILGFQLVEDLGEGTFSRVYLATERELGNRHVVVKLCTPSTGGREAQALGQLKHPHVVPVFSVQTEPNTGIKAICMPYLGRATLFDLVIHLNTLPSLPRDAAAIWQVVRRVNRDATPANTPRSNDRLTLRDSYVENLVRIGLQLANALCYTHERGIIHTDIKPSNVLLTSAGEALLLDFNLSRSPTLAAIGIGGTLEYMSPEQLRVIAGQSLASVDPDPRWDLFALAATLYELLGGHPPFGRDPDRGHRSARALEFLERHRRGPRPLTTLNANVDRRLNRLLQRCLAFNPNDRPASAIELRDALAAFLSRPSRVRRRLRPGKQRWLAVAGGAVLAAALAGFTWKLDTLSRPPEIDQGWQALVLKQYDKAAAHFLTAYQTDPRHGDARALAWTAYYLCREAPNQSGVSQIQQATGLNEAAIRSGLDNGAVLNNLGYCYLSTGDSQRACEVLQQAVTQEPPPPAAVYHNLLKAELVLAERERRVPDLRYVAWARNHCPPSPEIYWDCAAAYACTVTYAKHSPVHVAELRRMALVACQQALDSGGAPTMVTDLLARFPLLAEEPRFARLLERPSPFAGNAASPSRVVNPLDP